MGGHREAGLHEQVLAVLLLHAQMEGVGALQQVGGEGQGLLVQHIVAATANAPDKGYDKAQPGRRGGGRLRGRLQASLVLEGGVCLMAEGRMTLGPEARKKVSGEPVECRKGAGWKEEEAPTCV